MIRRVWEWVARVPREKFGFAFIRHTRRTAPDGSEESTFLAIGAGKTPDLARAMEASYRDPTLQIPPTVDDPTCEDEEPDDEDESE